MLKTEFNNLIASKLGDIGKVYWTNEEIDRIIDEASLNFGAISGYWKSKIILQSNSNQQIYDILEDNDVDTNFDKIKISLTYQTIIDWLDDNLVGYLQLADLAEIVSLITGAINAFQKEAKLVLKKNQYPITIGESVVIGQDVLDIVAAYYVDSVGVYHALQIADENSIALINNSYASTSARPRFYSINNLSLSIVDLFPRPVEDGFLELIYVVGVTGIQDEESSCLLPNNLIPYLKYKVLKDIFDKDNNADPFRAAYCKQRWEEGLVVGKNYAAITNIKLNGINRTNASLLDFDKFRYNWRNDLVAPNKNINAIALAGYNIIAFNRIPIADDSHSLMLECISNAPILDANIDIRVDYIPILLDYCIHLASIKDGIACIQKTQVNLKNFVKTAAAHNDYLQTRRISYLDLLQKSKYPLRQAKILEEENAA
jgi:hypothetical protein